MAFIGDGNDKANKYLFEVEIISVSCEVRPYFSVQYNFHL